MKNKIIGFIFVMLLIPFISSSVNVEMNSNFSQGETLIAKISGEFVSPLGYDNIYFYREHVKIPIILDIKKFGDSYYLYAILYNKVEGNYSLQLKDIQYKEFNKIVEEDFIKNFTITNQTADFYILPGFLQIKEVDYSAEEFTIYNLRSYDLEVEKTQEKNDEEAGFLESFFGIGSDSSEKEIITIPAGQNKKVGVGFNNNLTENTIEIITLSTENTIYDMPVYMLPDPDRISNPDEDADKALDFGENDLNVSMATSSSTKRIITLQNKGEIALENISIELIGDLEDYVFLENYTIEELEENDTLEISLNISSPDKMGQAGGWIRIYWQSEDKFEEIDISLPVYLYFIPNYIPSFNDSGDVDIVSSKTCEELEGKVCAEDEICDGETVYAKTKNCCLAECIAKDSESSSGKIFGWVLIGLIILFVLWFFLSKYKKVNSVVDLLSIAKGKN